VRHKHDRKEHKHKDKKVRDLTSSVKFNDAGKKPVMTVNDDNLKDVIK
jgi:cell division protein FtsL